MNEMVKVESYGLVNPSTGELIVATPENAAGLIPALRDLKRRIDETIRACSQLLVEASVEQGTKTLRYGKVTAKITGGPEVQWDVEFLREALTEAGCPEARIRDLIVEEISYKVKANVAKQLAGANPRYAEIVEAAKTMTDKPHTVSIS